jgi:uncharacterized protein YciI
MDLDEFELVILRRPETMPPYDAEERQRIQEEHLAFHARLRESGDVVVNGPLIDQPDETMRGLAFYRVGSLDRARELAETDPAVRAGVLRVEVMHWWCPPGLMVRPGNSITV